MHNNTISRPTNIILNIFFALYSFACIFPILLVISISFSDEMTLLKSGYSLIPKVFSAEAYRYILKDSAGILNAYGVSIFVSVTGTVLSMLVTALFAYPLSRSSLKYRNQLSFFVYFTMLFSGGMVPNYILITQYLCMKNNILVLILPLLLSASSVLILRTFFRTSIPDSIIESAKIDGAGEIRTFYSIVLPLALPGMATIGLFSMIAYWNDFNQCLMYVTNAKLYNLQFILYKMQMNLQFLSSLSHSRGGAAASEILHKLPTESARMAVAILAIGPIILTYPFFQRFFVKGLTIGAVKG